MSTHNICLILQFKNKFILKDRMMVIKLDSMKIRLSYILQWLKTANPGKIIKLAIWVNFTTIMNNLQHSITITVIKMITWNKKIWILKIVKVKKFLRNYVVNTK
jgi:hypothetical protein